MKNRFILLLLAVCAWANHVNAQADHSQAGDYLTGSAVEHIDPDSTVFSVALAGYGFPREGRFSIEWKYAGEGGGMQYLAACDGQLYGLNDRGELAAAGTAPFTWKRLERPGRLSAPGSITALTGGNGKLYAAVRDKGIFVLDLHAGSLAWKKWRPEGAIPALALLNGRLYAPGEPGRPGASGRSGGLPAVPLLRYVPPTCNDLGQTDTLCGLTAQGQALYGVAPDSTLWTAVPGRPWVRIGRYNGLTYDIVIRQLAVWRHRLYALAADGKVYLANHCTQGNLSARALAIRHGDKTVVLVGVDLTGIDYSFIQRVKATIWRERHIPPSAVFINISHTHFAPVSQGWPAWAEFLQAPDSNYLHNILEKGIVKAVERSLDGMTPSYLYVGRGETHIGHNRSSENRQTPYDTTLDVLRVTDRQGRIKNLIFITGCHPVFRNDARQSFTLNANYPGVTRKIIEDSTGARSALFLQGCGGDIDPVDQDHDKTGTDLAGDIDRVLQGPMLQVRGDLSCAFDSLSLPIHPWAEEKVRQFRAENAAHPGDVEAEKNVRWSDLMLDRYRKGTMPDALPEYVQTLNIGSWKLVGLSREVVTEYGMAIRELWPGKFVSVCGYTNAVPSYLPNQWHIDAGAYEGYDSFHWYGQAAVPEKDVFQQIVRQIHTWNR
jgi:hypothetical protein